MSCGCNGAMGAYARPAAVSGYDAATNSYSAPFPGAWFWKYKWPLSPAEASAWGTVQVGKYQVPPMVLMAKDPITKADRTPAQVEHVREVWEAGCKAGKFVGNMNSQCEAAKKVPSAAGYVAIVGGVAAIGGLAYYLLK